MSYNHLIHNRKSIRLQGYDYSSIGAYFLTTCSYQHHQLFGIIENNFMVLNQFGEIVREEWEKSAIIRDEIELGPFVIMPNHMHAIVIIHGAGVWPNAPTSNTNQIEHDKRLSGPGSKTIGSLMIGFKSSVTKRINLIRNTPGKTVWQRNFWEHIIRDDESYDKIVEYITTNSENWRKDQLFTS